MIKKSESRQQRVQHEHLPLTVLSSPPSMCKAVVDFAKLFCVAKLGASKMLSAEFLLLKSVQKIRRVL
jgi:hypothetical protein